MISLSCPGKGHGACQVPTSSHTISFFSLSLTHTHTRGKRHRFPLVSLPLGDVGDAGVAHATAPHPRQLIVSLPDDSIAVVIPRAIETIIFSCLFEAVGRRRGGWMLQFECLDSELGRSSTAAAEQLMEPFRPFSVAVLLFFRRLSNR